MRTSRAGRAADLLSCLYFMRADGWQGGPFSEGFRVLFEDVREFWWLHRRVLDLCGALARGSR